MLADGLGSKHLVDWVEYETEGYPKGVDLPSYRVVPTTYTGTFPWIRNAPIAPAIIKEHVGTIWTRREIRESIAEVNAWAKLDSLQIDTGNLLLLLQDDDEMSRCLSIVGHIPQTSLKRIQYMVRKRLVKLTLALEKSFSSAAAEARAAELSAAPKPPEVTQIVIQNIYGNVTNVGKVSVVAGSTDSLVEELMRIGLGRPDATELADLAESEGPGTPDEPLGKESNAWVKKYRAKIRDGALSAGGASILNDIKKAILDFLGSQ